MKKSKILGLASAAVVAASLVASALGYGPVAEEVKAAICTESK